MEAANVERPAGYGGFLTGGLEVCFGTNAETPQSPNQATSFPIIAVGIAHLVTFGIVASDLILPFEPLANFSKYKGINHHSGRHFVSRFVESDRLDERSILI